MINCGSTWQRAGQRFSITICRAYQAICLSTARLWGIGMKQMERYFGRRFAGPLRPPSLLFLWVTGSVLFFLAYAAIFAAFWPGGPTGDALIAALTNVLPLTLLAAVTRAVLKTYVMPLGVGVQGAAHLVLAPTFALIWYGAIIVLQAVLGNHGGQGGVQLIGFSTIALVWQAFQGLVLYALVAAICYAVRGGREAAPVSFVEAPPPLDRYLIRSGDEFVPIRIAEVATITGAQDYSEVTTANGRRHLVRLSLGEFERRLDPHRFIRVHRSSIVNLDLLDRLEPAGNGRMIAHMNGAEAVEVSRSGAQLLRQLVV